MANLVFSLVLFFLFSFLHKRNGNYFPEEVRCFSRIRLNYWVFVLVICVMVNEGWRGQEERNFSLSRYLSIQLSSSSSSIPIYFYLFMILCSHRSIHLPSYLFSFIYNLMHTSVHLSIYTLCTKYGENG